MKNIVVIGPAHPLRGGIAAYTQRMSLQFAKDGFTVYVYSFSLQYPAFLFPGKTQYSTDPAPAGLTIISRINSINPFNWLQVAGEISKLKPDAVVINFWIPFMAPCLGTLARIIKRKCNTSIIGVIHNLLPHEKRPGDKALSRYFIHSCDGFVTMNQKVYDDLSGFTNSSNKNLVQHPVYDQYGDATGKKEACRKLKLNPDRRYVLFFGLVRKYKGLDLLLEAMADSRVREMGIDLIVAGEFYDDKSEYETILKENNIYDHVVIRDSFIPDEEVKFYFSAADMVVLPYRNATQSGVSSLAIHFEKPLIVSNFGGLTDAVRQGETGFMVEADKTSIADAIVACYNYPEKESMREKIREERKRYSWAHVTKAIIQLSLKSNDLQK